MPLQDDMQIVSVDDHLIEHPRVWQDRVPLAMKEAAPKIVDADGTHQWEFEGDRFPTIGLNAVAGKPREAWGTDPVRYEDMIPGCYDPSARVKDMDLDGVQAALCFPSFPGFAAGVFHRAKDKQLGIECVRAWNDFYLEEWCGSAPDRFIPLSLLPTWDMDATVEEAERVAALGSRTVALPDGPVPLGLPSYHSDYWDPLWNVLQDNEIPLSLHFGSGGFVPGFSFGAAAAGKQSDMVVDDAPFAVAIAMFSTNLMWATTDFLFSGKLQQFPGLQISLAEGGIGWIPYVLERCDYTWERHRYYQKIDFDTRPSELYREHFWGCFIDDEHGLANLDAIGVDRVMLEIDFPHSDSNWPNSRKRAAETLVNVSDADCAKIVEHNARTMLHYPRTS